MSHERLCDTCRRPYACHGEPVDLGDAGLTRYICSVCDVEGVRDCEYCYAEAAERAHADHEQWTGGGR